MIIFEYFSTTTKSIARVTKNLCINFELLQERSEDRCRLILVPVERRLHPVNSVLSAALAVGIRRADKAGQQATLGLFGLVLVMAFSSCVTFLPPFQCLPWHSNPSAPVGIREATVFHRGDTLPVRSISSAVWHLPACTRFLIPWFGQGNSIWQTALHVAREWPRLYFPRWLMKMPLEAFSKALLKWKHTTPALSLIHKSRYSQRRKSDLLNVVCCSQIYPVTHFLIIFWMTANYFY